MNMRKFINIVSEGKILPFPGNVNPTNKLAVAKGGADIVGFPKEVPLNNFAKSYVETALWSSNDEGESLEKYSINDIATPTLQEMVEDCTDFQKINHADLQIAYDQIGYGEDQAGQDFWLTRNSHGSGFWGHKLGDVGERLTNAAHSYGEFNLFIGSDKMIHGACDF